MRFTLQSLCAISRCVLCVLVLVIIMCLGVWDGSLMETHFTLQSLCAISRCVSLCSCACYCVFGRVGVVTIVKGQHTSPCYHCAQEEVAWGLVIGCVGLHVRICAIVNHYAIFLARKVFECGQWRVNLFVCVRNSVVCVRNSEWGCLFNCELYF